MASVKRDYYEVLGVPRDADKQTIERAFHDLAREYHPDVTDDREADERFRELTEAYSVLASPEVRDIYDSRGHRGRGDPEFEEALADAGLEAPRRGENVHLDLELRDFEAREGTRRLVRYPVAVRCRACLGHGSVHVPGPETDVLDPCLRCDGRGVVQTEQQIWLRIPAEVQDEPQLRVRGEGNDAGAGSVPGDLLVHIHILPTPSDEEFEEALADAGLEAQGRGENVHLDLELRDFEAREGTRRLVRYPVAVRCHACLGQGSVHVPDPKSDLMDPCPRCDGRGVVQTEQQVRLRIPAEVQDEAQLRVRGEGNDAGAGSVPGDLLVHIHILPTPRDPRVIRYVAFALLVLAVVTLLVYLVR